MLTKLLPELAREENAGLIASLENMIASRRLPHAIIIEGDDPELNMRLARLIGRAHICSCQGKLSGECRVCRVIDSGGEHPDILEVSGSGKTGAISVDAVRALRLKGNLVPTEADGMVWIMGGCDIMLPPAQNAFLKLFEEPPEGVMFIMTCQSALRLLETIRSRAQIMRVNWHGGEIASGEEDAFAEQFALALVAASDSDAMMLTSRFSRQKKDAPEVRRELVGLIDRLAGIFRAALIIGAGAERILPSRSQAAEEIARTLSPERIEMMNEQLADLRQAVKTNAIIPLVTTAMCVRLRAAAGR
ncbi:MAG: hypothetical protein IJC18_04245 [Clostridia bacterium]|nr:hypothetical protein [Clostridia bacterium]